MTVYKRGEVDRATKIQQKAKQVLDKEKIDSSSLSIVGSNPPRALVETAKTENCDLIVVESRGLGGAASFSLGSVSRQVVTKASCDVLVKR